MESVGIVYDVVVKLIVNLTSVNDAGKVVDKVMPDEPILLVHDDINIKFGKAKLVLRQSGSGGHNGVKSVLNHSEADIYRLKIGIAGYNEINELEVLFDLEADVQAFEEVFAKATETLRSTLLIPFARELVKKDLVEDISKESVWMCVAHKIDIQELLNQLNIPQRRIKSLAPPAMAVLPWEKADKLIRAANILTEAVEVAYKNYRKALKLPGNHEIVDLLRMFVPDHIWRTGDTQKGVHPQYLNWDFHDGNGTTEVSLIEGNMSMGGPDEAWLLEKYLLENQLLPGGASTMNQSVFWNQGPIGIEAIAKYCIQPFIRKKEQLIAIVHSVGQTTTDDAHTYLLQDELTKQGYNAKICEGAELFFDSPENPTKVLLNNEEVSLVWNRLTCKRTILVEAVSRGLVLLMPFQGFKQFTRKSGLVYLNAPDTRDMLGIEHLAENLNKIVPFSTFITPDTVGIFHMLRRSEKFAVKYVMGGGGRKSFIVGPSNQSSAIILNHAAESYLHTPAIMQELAPRFDMPGTKYEFDVRVLIYTRGFGQNVERVLHWMARVYEKGGDKPLGFTPIIVV